MDLTQVKNQIIQGVKASSGSSSDKINKVMDELGFGVKNQHKDAIGATRARDQEEIKSQLERVLGGMGAEKVGEKLTIAKASEVHRLSQDLFALRNKPRPTAPPAPATPTLEEPIRATQERGRLPPDRDVPEDVPLPVSPRVLKQQRNEVFNRMIGFTEDNARNIDLSVLRRMPSDSRNEARALLVKQARDSLRDEYEQTRLDIGGESQRVPERVIEEAMDRATAIINERIDAIHGTLQQSGRAQAERLGSLVAGPSGRGREGRLRLSPEEGRRARLEEGGEGSLVDAQEGLMRRLGQVNQPQRQARRERVVVEEELPTGFGAGGLTGAIQRLTEGVGRDIKNYATTPEGMTVLAGLAVGGGVMARRAMHNVLWRGDKNISAETRARATSTPVNNSQLLIGNMTKTRNITADKPPEQEAIRQRIVNPRMTTGGAGGIPTGNGVRPVIFNGFQGLPRGPPQAGGGAFAGGGGLDQGATAEAIQREIEVSKPKSKKEKSKEKAMRQLNRKIL